MFAVDEKGGPSAIKCEGIESDEGAGSFPLCLLLFSLFRNRTFSRSHRNQKRVKKRKRKKKRKKEKEPETERLQREADTKGEKRRGESTRIRGMARRKTAASTEKLGATWRGAIGGVTRGELTPTERGEFSERTTKFPRAGLHKPQGRRSLFLHLVPPSAPPTHPLSTLRLLSPLT